jgi:hypothetical protein
MKFQIGAMSVGDILDRGLKLLLVRLPTFYLINLIVLAPLIAVQLALPALVPAAPTSEPTPAQAIAALGGLLLALLLLGLVLLILQPIGTAAILHVVAQEFVDQHAGPGAAFKFALRRFGKLLGTLILAGLVVALGFILCIVPGIIFWVWYVFVAQIVVVENLGGGRALERSKQLTDGFRGRVFGLLALFFVLSAMFQGAAGLLELVLPTTEQVRSESPAGRETITVVYNYPNYVIHTLVTQLLGILVQTFQAVCMTLLYFDLRIRKEGFDLELAAQQQPPTTT